MPSLIPASSRGKGKALKIILETVTCKICGSENVIRFGRYKGIQRWKCKDCRHKFADNNALPGMRIPYERVATAVGAYYEGRSLNSIPEVMYHLCGSFVTKASIDKWVNRFSRLAIAEAGKTSIRVGDTWLASENPVKVSGRSFWVIDIIDMETKFLLATRLSYGRAIDDIAFVMRAASNKAGKTPERIFTGDWKGYAPGIELAYGGEVSHIFNISSETRPGFGRLAEYWHNILRARNKVLSRLKLEVNAQMVLDGWLVHYNYFSIQEALNGRTPAGVARSTFKFHSWLDLVCQNRPDARINRFPGLPTPVQVPEKRFLKSSKLMKEFLINNAPLLFSQPYDGGEIILSQHKPKSNRIFRVLGNL
jgi:transposase-like protein